jgi:hypothetical protein
VEEDILKVRTVERRVSIHRHWLKLSQEAGEVVFSQEYKL